MVSERMVPIDHRDRNFFKVKKYLIDFLLQTGCLKNNNIHPFVTDIKSKDFGIQNHEEKLKKYGRAFDMVLLSSGEDGHIAALFPHHHSVRSDADFFLQMHHLPKPPPQRMSITKNLQAKADTSVLLFFGPSKRDALAMFPNKRVDPLACSAKLALNNSNTFVLSDQKL